MNRKLRIPVSKIVPLMTAASLTLGLCTPPTTMAFAARKGRETFRISDEEDLKELAKRCTVDTYSENLDVVLDDDISIAEREFTPIPYFSGSFDGQGHTIRGVVIRSAGSALGLFRYAGRGARISNLHVEGRIEPAGSATKLGGIVGSNAGTIRGCSFRGRVRASEDGGGIAGINTQGGAIIGCSFEGRVISQHKAGGITGENSGSVVNCINAGEVNTEYIETDARKKSNIVSGITNLPSFDVSSMSAEDFVDIMDVGGIAGYSAGTVSECTNRGIVGYPHTGYNVGGIVGRAAGFTVNCSNEGAVSGRRDAGGIAGQLEPESIWEYSRSQVEELKRQLIRLNELIDTLAKDVSDSSGEIRDDIAAASGYAQQTVGDLQGITDDIGTQVEEASSAIQAATSELQAAYSQENGRALGEALDQLARLIRTTEFFQLPVYVTVKGNSSSELNSVLNARESDWWKKLDQYLNSREEKSGRTIEGTLDVTKNTEVELASGDEPALTSGSESGDLQIGDADPGAGDASLSDLFSLQPADPDTPVPDGAAQTADPDTVIPEDGEQDVYPDDMQSTGQDGMPGVYPDDTQSADPDGMQNLYPDDTQSGYDPDVAGNLNDGADQPGDVLAPAQEDPGMNTDPEWAGDVFQEEGAPADGALEEPLYEEPQETGSAGIVEEESILTGSGMEEDGSAASGSDLIEDTVVPDGSLSDTSAGSPDASAGTGPEDGSTGKTVLDYSSDMDHSVQAGDVYSADSSRDSNMQVNVDTNLPDTTQLRSLIYEILADASSILDPDAIENALQILQDLEVSAPDTAPFYSHFQDLIASVVPIADSASLMTGKAASDIDAITDQLDQILETFFSLAQNISLEDQYTETDVSGQNPYQSDTASVESCSNTGEINGDTNAGGIAGCIGFENKIDAEGVLDVSKYMLKDARYTIFASERKCLNQGPVRAKKESAGGICGSMEFGIITDSANTGEICVDEGDYCGGICGKSQGTITDCCAGSLLSGGAYVGGIAGKGQAISGCVSYSYIGDSREYMGAIAGDADGKVSGCQYVDYGIGGVDNIGYAEAARPVRPKDPEPESAGASAVLQEELPASGSTCTLTFVVEDRPFEEISVPFGGSLEKLPEVPNRGTDYWVWDDFDKNHIFSSQTITGAYHRAATTIASEGDVPDYLVEGTFYEGQKLQVEEFTVQDSPVSTESIVEVLENRIRPSGENETEDPEGSGKAGESGKPGQELRQVIKDQLTGPLIDAKTLTVNDYDKDLSVRARLSAGGRLFTAPPGEDLKETAYEKDGSYIVFPLTNGGSFVYYESIRQDKDMRGRIALAGGIAAGACLLLIVLLIRRRKKKRRAKEEKETKEETE